MPGRLIAYVCNPGTKEAHPQVVGCPALSVQPGGVLCTVVSNCVVEGRGLTSFPSEA